jgi:hypothetical protein
MEQPALVQKAGQVPRAITLQAFSQAAGHSSALIRAVRQNETRCASYPNVRITRHTQPTPIAGLNAVEFEFADDANHAFGRHVYLQTDVFTLQFILIAGNESDRVMFDEFLKSIRLESPVR